jgi:hypothetical protein
VPEESGPIYECENKTGETEGHFEEAEEAVFYASYLQERDDYEEGSECACDDFS